MYDLRTKRAGSPCECGERDEAIDVNLGLFCCIQCGTPAAGDQPDTDEQHRIRRYYRAPADVRARFEIVDGKVLPSSAPAPEQHSQLEALAQRIAVAWHDTLEPTYALDVARATVTPLAFPDPTAPTVGELASSVLTQRRKQHGLPLSDALIATLAERAQRTAQPIEAPTPGVYVGSGLFVRPLGSPMPPGHVR